MKTSLQISIPEPCTQPWDNMTPDGAGRHCAHCDKTVTDFSAYTDVQLYHFFSQQREPLCGRMLTTQLNRPIIPQRPADGKLYRLALALGLTIMFAQAPVVATYARAPLVNEYVMADTTANKSDKTATLSGNVKSEEGPPLVATVSVFSGLTCAATVTTDNAGDFSITLAPGRYSVQIARQGFEMVQRDIDVPAAHNTFYAAVLNLVPLNVLRPLPVITKTAGAIVPHSEFKLPVESYKLYKPVKKKNSKTSIKPVKHK